MLSRKEHDIAPIYLPKVWTDEVKQILLNVYGDRCLDDDKTFEVFALTYPSEVLLFISYLDTENIKSPVTLSLSVDLNEATSSTNSKKLLDTLVNVAGEYFDIYFTEQRNSEELWDGYVYDWEEEERNKLTFFYKINRENVALAIEANKLLEEF